MFMQTKNIPLFPEQASSFAADVDYLFFYIVAICVFFGVGVVAVVALFAYKYRAKEKFASPENIHGSLALEFTWTVIPFVLAMSIFVFGAVVYHKLYRMPEDAMEIFVVGKQWMWKVQHRTGQREINELHVPVGKKIKLTMTTEDVLHDFYIPAFRTKMDTVPGRYTYLWFEATKPGKYRLLCAEYCGLNHSGMGGYVYVMEQRHFDNWLSGTTSGQTPVQAGEDLFANKLGCASCHAGGDTQRGAKLEGIFGKTVKFVDGSEAVRDEQYIRNSILNPGGQVVEGFQPIMPTFKGQVTEEQLVALVEYIKSLSPDASNAAPTSPASDSSGGTDGGDAPAAQNQENSSEQQGK